jgi:hypothetical protein
VEGRDNLEDPGSEDGIELKSTASKWEGCEAVKSFVFRRF